MLKHRKYVIHTRTATHAVTAVSARHAVAAVVARLGLTEQQTQMVMGWRVEREDKEATQC